MPTAAPTAVIVDDSPIVRHQLQQLLTMAGYEVVGQGAQGDDVLPLYRQHQPDLITVDIVMPGTDGVTAAQELLGEHPEATVVMCTSLASRDKILACQRAGVTHYLLKPFDADRVVAILARIRQRTQHHLVEASAR